MSGRQHNRRSNPRGMAAHLWLALLSGLSWAANLAHAQTETQATFRWERLSGGPLSTPGVPHPTNRSSAALVYAPLARKLILFGGNSIRGMPTDVWAYDMATRTWQELPSMNLTVKPSQRTTFAYGLHTAPATAAGETLIVAHGTRQGNQVNSEVWGYSLNYQNWTLFPSLNSGPEARYGMAFGSYPGSEWFMLSHGFGKTRRLSDVWALSPSTYLWHRVWQGNDEYTPTQPHPRCLVGSAMATPNRLVLYGGCLTGGFTGGPCPARDAWIIDVQGNASDPAAAPHSPSFHQVEDGPSGRTYPGMARLPKSMGLGTGMVLMIGGHEDSKQIISVDHGADTDLDILDTNNKRWLISQATNAAPVWRSTPAMATSEPDAAIFMFGGQLRDILMDSDELWMLTRVPDAPPTSGSGPMSGTASGYLASGWYIPVRSWTTSSFSYIALHGIFMGLAWGIILPLGVVGARYLRHKDPFWFNLHRAFQITGVSLSIVGLIVIFVGGARNPVFAHGMIGLITMVLGLLQPINAVFRPHKGKKWRDHWEWLHKGSGYLAVILGLVNVSLGVFLVLAGNALIIAWFVILGVMVVGVVGLEARRWWVARNQPPPLPKADADSDAKVVQMEGLEGLMAAAPGKAS